MKWWIIVLFLWISGCHMERPQTLQAHPVSVPNHFFQVKDQGHLKLGGKTWCAVIQDKALGELIEHALKDNLTLQSGWMRIVQSRAVLKRVSSGRHPMVSAEIDLGRSRIQAFRGGTEDQNSYKLMTAASYEVDLWGKVSDQIDSAALDLKASEADLKSMAISVAAQITEAWIDLRYQRAKRVLIEREIQVHQNYLELIEWRLSLGQATGLDILQERQQLDATRSRLILIRAQEDVAKERLAILLGKPLSELTLPETQDLPAITGLPTLGVPGDLLKHRPDIQAAMWRLESADAQMAAAFKAWLPSLKLSASIFVQATEWASLFDDLLWNLGSALSEVIWDGGRRSAEVEQANAGRRLQWINLLQTLLTAIQEVEMAMSGIVHQEAWLKALKEQLEQSQALLDLSRARYSSGTLDYLRVLTALQAHQKLEEQVLDAERDILKYHNQLCRALGGWSPELSEPESWSQR